MERGGPKCRPAEIFSTARFPAACSSMPRFVSALSVLACFVLLGLPARAVRGDSALPELEASSQAASPARARDAAIPAARKGLSDCLAQGADCAGPRAALAKALWLAGWNLYRSAGRDACAAALGHVEEALQFAPALSDWWAVNVGVRCSLHLGFLAFVSEDLDAAEKHMRAVAQWAIRNHDHRSRWEKHDHPPMYLDAIRRLRSLGPTEPVVRHRILAVHVLETDAVQEHTGGKTRRCKGRWDPALIEQIKRQQKAVTLYFRAISQGRLELEWENRAFRATARILSPTTVDVESISPPLGEVLAGTAGSYDTYAIYYLCPSPCTAVATGGLSSRPLVPYQLRTVTRGHINVHPSYTQGYHWGVLLHEFFHVVGALIHVDGHGYLADRRHKYPGWKGATGDQHSFRVWHFENLARASAEAGEFLKLNIRSVHRAPREDHYRLQTEKTRGIPEDNMRRAAELALPLGDALYKARDHRRVIGFAEGVLALNPFHNQALQYKGLAHITLKEFALAAPPLSLYVSMNRGADLWSHVRLCGLLEQVQGATAKKTCLQELVRDFPDGPLEQGAFHQRLFRSALAELRVLSMEPYASPGEFLLRDAAGRFLGYAMTGSSFPPAASRSVLSLSPAARNTVAVQTRDRKSCLDVNGGSYAEGAPLSFYRCHGGKNQRFRLLREGTRVFVVADFNGMVVTWKNDRLVQRKLLAGGEQSWELTTP